MIHTQHVTRKMRRMLDEARREKLRRQAALVTWRHRYAIWLWQGGET